MSLKNLEEAPKARRIVTPAIVSPYMEYRGERVTESATENDRQIHIIGRQ